MIIPDRVNVCGTVFELELVDDAKVISNGIGCGMCSAIEQKIYIFRNMGFTDSTNNTVKIIPQQLSSIINTFYHEVFHAIMSTCGLEEHNTESNANLFGNIAMQMNEDNNLLEIFAQFKAVATEIPEADYRKIQYVVENTKFEFDGFSGLDESNQDDMTIYSLVNVGEMAIKDRNEDKVE